MVYYPYEEAPVSCDLGEELLFPGLGRGAGDEARVGPQQREGEGAFVGTKLVHHEFIEISNIIEDANEDGLFPAAPKRNSTRIAPLFSIFQYLHDDV